VKYKKIVIKIGSSVIAKTAGNVDKSVIEGLVSQVSRLLDKGAKVIIVTSGAICAGRGILRSASNSLSDMQAMASAGQSELMRLYGEAFKKKNYLTGQVLLTQEDFDDRRRYMNIKYTIDSLLSKNVVPIVNENDTVSTEEIKLGDNDRLSSLVADLCAADVLVMLSDVDGLYDENGVVPVVDEITEKIEKLVKKKMSLFTKGGMATKIEAARRATRAGIDCFIALGTKPGIVLDILRGREKNKYTLFKARPVKAKAKKRWIAFSSKVKGRIIVDEGAKKALAIGHKSLLTSGITGKEGAFRAGDVIGIAGPRGREFARGLVNYSSKEIERIKGLKTSEIESALGYKDHDEAVHRDNLVIL